CKLRAFHDQHFIPLYIGPSPWERKWVPRVQERQLSKLMRIKQALETFSLGCGCVANIWSLGFVAGSCRRHKDVIKMTCETVTLHGFPP
ncbi:hypothetical protein, partial [Rhodoferax sp.]|uniref:hypothetical protein n=1 Tax=Rhodoferax sp. TaxID=50421 RepID=UPI00283D2244